MLPWGRRSVREVTLENARWFQGAWAGDVPTSQYVRSVWNEKFRKPDEKYLRRLVFPLTRFVDGFLERRDDWDAAGVQAFLAEIVAVDFEYSTQLKLNELPLVELHLPDLPEGKRGSLTVSGVRPSFKQLNYALHNAPNLGDANHRVQLLSGYEMTLSMLLVAAWHGEPRDTLTGLPLLDAWMNAMSEGLQEYVLPESKLREKVYRLRVVQRIERAGGLFTGAETVGINYVLQTPLDRHITEEDFRLALNGVSHDRD